uniref:Uncharacterized protein n=1 Tax=Aegilops tauschii subsp. strangulata TaxID=200361 RepID=A0A453F2Y5_AEGTS
ELAMHCNCNPPLGLAGRPCPRNTLETAPRALKRPFNRTLLNPIQSVPCLDPSIPSPPNTVDLYSPLPKSSSGLLHLDADMAAAAASDLESKAKEAFVDDDFELAAELYTQAIEAGPATAELYADRAQAHIKLGSYTEAVADANKAIELDPSMHKAYLRKGSACIKLEEYQTAKAALEVGSSYASGDSRFTRLMKECDDRIAEEASQVPVKNAAAAVAPATSSGASSGATTVATEVEDQDGANMENAQPTVEVPSKPKYRHDYYNTPTEVVLTIFAKGVPADSVVVDFGEQMVCFPCLILANQLSFHRVD